MEMLDTSFVDKINTFGGAAVVIVTYLFGEHWTLFGAFLLLNLFDVVTGIAKSKILKTESSAQGLKGVVKKFGSWCMIALAFLMSPLFNEIGETINVDIHEFTPFIGYMVLAMLIINEFRSVMENLVECGVTIPPIIISGFAILEKVAADKQASYYDGNLSISKKSDEPYQVQIDTPIDEIEKKDTVKLRITTVEDEED